MVSSPTCHSVSGLSVKKLDLKLNIIEIEQSSMDLMDGFNRVLFSNKILSFMSKHEIGAYRKKKRKIEKRINRMVLRKKVPCRGESGT